MNTIRWTFFPPPMCRSGSGFNKPLHAALVFLILTIYSVKYIYMVRLRPLLVIFRPIKIFYSKANSITNIYKKRMVLTCRTIIYTVRIAIEYHVSSNLTNKGRSLPKYLIILCHRWRIFIFTAFIIFQAFHGFIFFNPSL